MHTFQLLTIKGSISIMSCTSMLTLIQHSGMSVEERKKYVPINSALQLPDHDLSGVNVSFIDGREGRGKRARKTRTGSRRYWRFSA